VKKNDKRLPTLKIINQLKEIHFAVDSMNKD